jgi:cytosine/adenosine deaminase-related metal-dependent hydrolase
MPKQCGVIAAVMAIFLALLAAPVWAGCVSKPGDGRLLIRATILVPNAVLKHSAVLIGQDGRIACVGRACVKKTGGASRIDCTDAVLSPGFINGHEHLAFADRAPVADSGVRYGHRHDWRKGLRGYTALESFKATEDPDVLAWGELRHLLSGTTSIMGGAMAPGLTRNLDVYAGLEGLKAPRATYVVFPFNDAAGIERESDCDYGPLAATTEAVAAAHAYVMHLSEGRVEAARNEFRCASDPDYDRTAQTGGGGMAQDIVLANVTIIHGVALDKAMLQTVAKRHAVLVWSPRSNLSLYGATLDITDALALKIPVALGTDWLPSGSVSMAREAACARQYAAGVGKPLSARTLWQMMTINGAKAARMDDRIGSIRSGIMADIILVDAKKGASPYEAVVTAAPENMIAIIRGGRVLSGDRKIVKDPDCEEVDVNGRAKRLCLKETGRTYADLSARMQAANIWPAFFAGPPPVEPTCEAS